MDAYFLFSGVIDQAAADRFTALRTQLDLHGNSVSHAHIAIHSTGGIVANGVYIHQLLRTFPCRVTLYNLGAVASIAAVMFLAVSDRKCTPNAVFCIHAVRADATAGTARDLYRLADRVAADDARTWPVLAANLALTDLQKQLYFDGKDLVFDAPSALAAGFVDEIVVWMPAAPVLII